MVEATIQRLKDNGFLGDDQFAQDWVENRSTFRPRSKRMLAMELRQKGVAEEAIEQALAETEDESSLAYQIRDESTRGGWPGSDWETFRKRLGAYLDCAAVSLTELSLLSFVRFGMKPVIRPRAQT